MTAVDPIMNDDFRVAIMRRCKDCNGTGEPANIFEGQGNNPNRRSSPPRLACQACKGKGYTAAEPLDKEAFKAWLGLP